ncbi:ATP-dependent DNA helicase DinG [Bacillus marinisedimentorum]|uniref:ATP-dependent DNA helicase DinG n=1 Tax=Bacillus marinisedimentorum TaxID=1821260 RepID=UPI000871C6D0|nr:ATP-dependent DNA helicase DinG [Bacillus marinisedimentorum]
MSKFAVIDIETTGNQPKSGDSIIEIGAVIVEDGIVTGRFETLINPLKPIPPFISSLTGITDAMVAEAPLFLEIAAELHEMLGGSFFVAHNVPFDLGFLQQEFEENGYLPFSGPRIDTVELARLLYPSLGSYKLNELADVFGLNHTAHHRAASDAEATAALLVKMLAKLEALPIPVLKKLLPLSKKLKSSLSGLIHSTLDRKQQENLYGLDDGYEEIEGLVFKKTVRQTATSPEIKVDNRYEKHIEHMTGSGGRLSRAMGTYENRPGQREMMDKVHKALTNHSHLLIEAGTGTGKTLGYMVPAAFHSHRTGEPVVISTQTVQLQDQLLEKDMPALKEALPFAFSASILKGRSRYLCPAKLARHFHDLSEDNYDRSLMKGQLLIWLTETDTGDMDELNPPSGGDKLLKQVSAASCTHLNCPFSEKCFYALARNRAARSNVIIINHALLMADLKAGAGTLPDYGELIVDEAHHLEEACGKQFGIQLDYASFQSLFQLLGTKDNPQLVRKLTELADVPENQLNPGEFEHFIEQAQYELDELLRLIHSYVMKRRVNTKSEIGRISYKLSTEKESNSFWRTIQEIAMRVDSRLAGITRIAESVKSRQGIPEALPEYAAGLMDDFFLFTDILEERRIQLSEVLLDWSEGNVYWIEVDPKGAKNAIYLYSQPISVSDLLADSLFAKKRSVILTSATLTVSHSFSYMIDRLGLYDIQPDVLEVPSPFNFMEQVKVMVPTDIPNIKEVDNIVYVQEIAEKIIDIARVTKGRMLILFTSYEMLKQTYFIVKGLTAPEELILIGQGINSTSRTRLTKNFKQFDNAVLFGTSSFWEGVDIPGEDLSCLIIVRLPFAPPDNPVIQAKSSALRLAGKSAFNSFTLPQAVIRFKQGFGRLIRSGSDKGAVFVFDRRLVTAKYGKVFLQSLPDVELIEKPSSVLINFLDEWL